MKITSVEICHFKNYVDVSTISLDVTAEKNIVLIGGYNGSGKTSFVEAIRLCLYGKRFSGSVMSESKYQEYLHDVCSKKHPGGFSISMDILLDEENPPVDITIERIFTKNGSKYDEELNLKKGDSAVELISADFWSYYIERIIPPASSKYFFFDGEKVQGVLCSDQSNAFLQEAVDELTGVSQLLNLKKDLAELRKRILASTQEKDTGKLEELRGELERKNSNLVEIEAYRSARNLEIKDRAELLSELESQRARVIGSTEAKRKQFNSRVEQLNGKLDECNHVVSDFAYSKLPFLMMNSSIKRTIDRAVSEDRGSINQYSVLTLKKYLEMRDLSQITGISNTDSFGVIQGLIKDLQSKSSTSDGILDLTVNQIDQLRQIIVTEEEKTDYLNAVRNREFYKGEVAEFTKRLSKLSDDSVTSLDEHIIVLSTEIEVMRRQDEKDASRIYDIEMEIAELENVIKREERQLILGDVDRESIKNIDAVRNNIDNRIAIARENSVDVLSKKINSIYRSLANTSDMVKTIRITPTLNIELIGYDDELVKISLISEGEKGILMYAVIFGLHSLSKMGFPMIIDSPLGRMDSLHVSHLIHEYYPSISHQVIILSHDREVIGESLNDVMPFVSHTYTIRKYETPKIVSGYFE